MSTRFHTWIFVGSILLAILAGLGQLRGDWAVWVLALLGLILAFLNRSRAETAGFLLPAIALQMSAGAAQAIPAVGELATNILKNIVTFTSGILLFMAVQAIVGRLNFKSYSVVPELLGLLVAILAAVGIFGDGNWPIALLAAIGVLVGILRTIARAAEDKNSMAEQAVSRFLLSAIALLLSAAAFNNVPVIGALVSSFFTNIVILVSAVMVVVAFVAAFRWLEEPAA